MDRENLLLRIKKSIKQKEPEATVYLFGSRARNDFHEGSDWDILILTQKEKITNEIDDFFRTDLYDLELETGEIISILIYNKEFWQNKMKYSPLYQNVKKEGVLL
jgi:uncharacterized protein